VLGDDVWKKDDVNNEKKERILFIEHKMAMFGTILPVVKKGYSYFTLPPSHRDDRWVEKIIVRIRSRGTEGAGGMLHWFIEVNAAVTNR